MLEPPESRTPTSTTRRWMIILGCVAVLGLAIGLLLPPVTGDHSPAAVRRLLNEQAAAWNRGDLDGFLEGYWHSPEVVFQSGGTRNDGFDAMRDRYRKRYQSEGRVMGHLTFSDLEIETLGGKHPTHAFARGRYTLDMPDGSHPTGLFTLILRLFDDGWRIVHDHTSSADPAPAPPPSPASP